MNAKIISNHAIFNGKPRSIHLYFYSYKKEEERADRLYQDELLSAYIRDVSALRSTENFSLSNPITAITLSAQTQHTLRQLDSKRKVFLLEFIYKAGLLMADQQIAIDLDGADLTSIDFSGPTDRNKVNAIMQRKISGLALPGVLLANASFINADLRDANFSRVIAAYTNFSYANLQNANFFRADLRYVDLRDSYFTGAHFTGTDFTGALVDWSYLHQAESLLGAKLPNGTFMRHGPNILREDDMKNCIFSSSWNKTKGHIVLPKETDDDDHCYFAADIKEPETHMHQLIDLRRYAEAINEGHISYWVDGEWGDNRTRLFSDCSIVILQLDIQLDLLTHGGIVI